jgi:iron only hydrogenase large subunit-like protein
MQAIARFIKKGDPKAKVVFVGPCIAKKGEVARGKGFSYVDCVITFEELQALIDARGIDLPSLAESPLDNASYFGRIFAGAAAWATR